MKESYYAILELQPPLNSRIRSKILILSFNRSGFLLYIWAVVQEFSILPPNVVVKIRIDKSNRGWPSGQNRYLILPQREIERSIESDNDSLPMNHQSIFRYDDIQLFAYIYTSFPECARSINKCKSARSMCWLYKQIHTRRSMCLFVYCTKTTPK